MKTQKSSDNEDVTPTKKVLKQARLPFMILSDVSPKSVTPQSRKRKLSAPEPEPVTKLSKISKETDLAEELVVISDDDSKEAPQVKKVDKQLNPYVKLVDTAWKKKAQKAKNSKKKKSDSKKSKIIPNGSIENDENACESSENDEKKNEKVEDMEVDGSEDIEIVPDEIDKQDLKSENYAEISNSLSEKCEKNNIVTLEDSNCSEDAKKQNGECSSNEKDSPGKEKDSLHITSENEVETSEPEKNIANSNNDNIVTPKRINNSKSEEKITDSSLISNCDESLSSNLSTPRRSTRQVSLTNSQDVSLTENTKITPKQLQKKLESAKKKEEREKEKTEREKKRQQEKDERARQKQEKEEQRKKEREEKEEAKKKEKEEKEEQRKREREEKEKQKEIEKKTREEKEEQKRKEREEKEEQKKKEKEAKEEEKRKKQEALEQEKIEQEQKKKKAAEVFVSFFVPKLKGEKEQVTLGTVSNNDILSNFTIKSDMRLAPTIRVTLDGESRKVLDSALQEQNVSESSLYIKSLKGSHKPLSNGKTWPLSDKDEDDDVMIVEDELPTIDGASETIACDIVKHEKLRPKMLAFHENRRPPYWGTWRKRSKFINPRRPFKTDEKLVDYEVDSDEEWEEEQEGESIDGSAAGSDDEQDADEYEVDNEVFVPHGYLSDEEATMDEDDVLSLSPETQKARLKYLEDEFEFEMKKPMEKLKPRLYGLLWETADGSRPENCAEALWNYFGKLSMIMNDPTPFLQPSNETEDPDKKKVKKKKTTDAEQKSPKNDKKKKSKTDDKERKKPKVDTKKTAQEVRKNQPGINAFLTKIKT